MTKLQWQVILALCRLVLKIESKINDDNHEWFDKYIIEDRNILEEALKGEENK